MSNRNEFAEKLLGFFKLGNKKYDLKELHKLFSLKEEEIECFDDALLDLQIKSKLYLNEYDEYLLFPSDKDFFVEKLKQNKHGKYYVIKDNKVFYIDERYLEGAIQGDNVLIIKNQHNNDAKVKKVIYRDTSKIIVDCVNINGNLSFISFDKSFPYSIILKDSGNLVEGDRIALKLEKVQDNIYTGTLLYHIGHKDDPNLDIKTLATLYDIDIDFSQEVLEEAYHLPTTVTEKDCEGRLDLRDKMIFTIDGKDTKDMDDAISLEINDNGNYLLGVHIADVSHYIIKDSLLFQEALKRGTSVYPANFVIPLFPHLISNGICSLNPNVDRLAISCIMEIDKNGKVIDYNIEKSVINSRKKMSYEDVNQILEQNNIIYSYDDYVNNLNQMRNLHNILDKNKMVRGYLNFGDSDTKTTINADGEVIGVQQIHRGVSEKIIEDYMLLANETIAKHFSFLSVPTIYRVHDAPNKETMSEILNTIEELGYKIKKPQSLNNSYSIQGILKQISNLEIYPILSEMILQGMKRAFYSPNNTGHFGLALKNYTHFTSPIRRFPDLLVHTLIKDNYDCSFSDKGLSEIAKHCSEKQKKADDFEKKVNSIKAIEYMQNHSDDESIAKICFLGSKNLLLKTEQGIYGSLLLTDLTEKYRFIPSKKALVGNNSSLFLGDEIIIKVKKIESDNGKIFFKECSSKTKVRELKK